LVTADRAYYDRVLAADGPDVHVGAWTLLTIVAG
jgi:hypothetical protein